MNNYLLEAVRPYLPEVFRGQTAENLEKLPAASLSALLAKAWSKYLLNTYAGQLDATTKDHIAGIITAPSKQVTFYTRLRQYCVLISQTYITSLINDSKFCEMFETQFPTLWGVEGIKQLIEHPLDVQKVFRDSLSAGDLEEYVNLVKEEEEEVDDEDEDSEDENPENEDAEEENENEDEEPDFSADMTLSFTVNTCYSVNGELVIPGETMARLRRLSDREQVEVRRALCRTMKRCLDNAEDHGVASTVFEGTTYECEWRPHGHERAGDSEAGEINFDDFDDVFPRL